jgi:hypothetical protein
LTRRTVVGEGIVLTDRERRPRARVLTVAPDRFSAGWRLVPQPDFVVAPIAPSPDLVVDLVRASDLAAFTVEGYGVELLGGDRARVRAKRGETGRLVVRFAYQHAAERAIYEEASPVPSPDPTLDWPSPNKPPVPTPGKPIKPVDQQPPAGEPATHVPPIEARPARASRLVLELADGEEIAFTTEGFLDALSRLAMIVHPLATPRTDRVTVPADAPFLHLPGGLVATVTPNELVISRAPRGVAIPDSSTAEGMARLSRDGRRVRALLATRAGTSVAGLSVEGGRGPGTLAVDGAEHAVDGLLGSTSLIRPDIGSRIRRRGSLSRPPEAFETAIEAPYRLIVSPSASEGWTHALAPVGGFDAPQRIEIWHSRLGVRGERDGKLEVDERTSTQRIVRAVWARDREGPELFEKQTTVAFPDWQDLTWPRAIEKPFLSSMNGGDRHMLVRQSSESWPDDGGVIPPDPVDVAKLWLSSLGAWLDLHGDWDTDPYSAATMRSILLWDHVAPMGRDQYVRVVYPGFLFPFGHKTTLVKLTERKMMEAAPSVAGLFQRKFLVVGEPSRVFAKLDLPFTEVRMEPLVTPTLVPNPDESTYFIPMVDNQPFRWVLHCLDQEGRPVRLVTPLVWVPAGLPNADLKAVEDMYAANAISTVAANGQDVAYAEARAGGDTVVATEDLVFEGTADRTTRSTSTPRMRNASVQIPVVQQLSPIGAVPLAYQKTYLLHGFDAAANPGEVWAAIATKPALAFGPNASSGSDKAGGFLQPNLEVAGLSRLKGTVGDIDEVAKGNFRPEQFLGNALPRLFGLVELSDLLALANVDLDDAPEVITKQLDRIEGFLADLERAKRVVDDAVAEAQLLQQRAATKAAALQQQANDALAAAQQLRTRVVAAVDEVVTKLGSLTEPSEADVQNAMAAPLQHLRSAVADMETVAPKLPPLIREQLVALAGVLRQVADAADVIEDLVRFANQLATGAVQLSFRYEWKPKLAPWPDKPPNAILEVPERGLVIAVEGRASKDEMHVEVLAELKDFALTLLPGEPLVRFAFDHLSFHGGSSAKADVDVVLQKIEFLGILGFVETLRELIPFDGFSDPPFLDVTSEGLSAGFTLALPNVAIGVFTLSNVSLGADVQVPFLGKAVTVGFNFCTRERPFTLAVAFIGGGGWFLIRLSPDGLDVLELGLEAGAILSVDFGVASGSISAMLGVYMRLEGDSGSLSGYFRLRGEVDVLGLISASIELYLVLQYEFDSGKMVGSAKLTIKVEVFCFSTSVTITCERQFAGSKGDPNFRDVMVLKNGTSPAWSEYCLAFAGA